MLLIEIRTADILSASTSLEASLPIRRNTMAEIKKKTLRLTTLAVLGALAIVLSALENLIPLCL